MAKPAFIQTINVAQGYQTGVDLSEGGGPLSGPNIGGGPDHQEINIIKDSIQQVQKVQLKIMEKVDKFIREHSPFEKDSGAKDLALEGRDRQEDGSEGPVQEDYIEGEGEVPLETHIAKKLVFGKNAKDHGGNSPDLSPNHTLHQAITGTHQLGPTTVITDLQRNLSKLESLTGPDPL